MTLTESEVLFEEFCAHHGIHFERVQTGAQPTPDYRICPCGTEVVCEVKQVEPNPEEKTAMETLIHGGSVVIDGTPGARVRSKITSASPQLRNLAKGKHPALLALSETPNVAGHLGPYQIRVAMYGLDTLVIGVPHDPAASPYLSDRKSGPKRKMTSAHNTTISAVVELRRNSSSNLIECDIYHNKFATISLPKELLTGTGVRHFRLRQSRPGEFDDWEEF